MKANETASPMLRRFVIRKEGHDYLCRARDHLQLTRLAVECTALEMYRAPDVPPSITLRDIRDGLAVRIARGEEGISYIYDETEDARVDPLTFCELELWIEGLRLLACRLPAVADRPATLLALIVPRQLKQVLVRI